MVKGTFVLSALVPKTIQQKERVKSRSTKMRYAIVVLAIAVVFTYQICFDNPSALQEHIEHNYETKTGQQLGGPAFNWLYSIYSFPNVIIPLIGGPLIDKLGARVIFIATCIFCVIGQLICSWGGLQSIFWVMLIGRGIFGIGGQVLQGSQSTIISNWFKAEQLPLVLGICLCVPKLGSALNNYVTPILAQHFGSPDPQNYSNVGIPMFISFIAMCLGLVCTVVVFCIDRSTEQKSNTNFQTIVRPQLIKSLKLNPKLTPKNAISKIPFYSPPTKPKKLPKIKEQRSKNQDSEDQDHIVQKEVADINKSEEVETISTILQKKQTGGQHINCKQILKLPGSYWLLIIISMLCQALFIPFLDNGNKYYIQIFIGVDSPEEAGIYLVMPYLIAAGLVPVLGLWVEKVEKRSYLIMLTVFFFCLTYGIMMVTETSVSLREAEWMRWVPVTCMGIGIGMFCAIIVPTLPMIVNPKLLGTAFGLMEMLQNLALGFFPLIIGAIRERVSFDLLEGFHEQSLFFFLTGCLSIGLSFVLKAVDLTSGGYIDRKEFRKKYIKEVLQPVTVIEY